MAQPFDPYRALGIRREATEAEVKAAHRKLAKRFHPDADGGDRDRFLRVQEAYRVLSDPLLRREWDVKHAPGPMRGGAAAAGSPAASSRARSPRRPQRPQKPVDPDEAAPPPTDEPPSRRPRSSRAYTWSAAEVPWWEEGMSENRRQPSRKRPPRQTSKQGAPDPDAPPPPVGPDGTNPFDVYNRSSGAAWSSAARAYFRRGDQDLPRRGSWQYEGTQVLTGARARTYAEAQARRRANAPRPEPPQPQPQPSPSMASAAAAGSAAHGSAFTYTTATAGVARDAHRIHEVRKAWQRRTNAASWPSLKERMLYALLAWIPAALVIGYGGPQVAGCDAATAQCPQMVETTQAVAIALVLGLLVGLPKLAYVGAMAAIGGLLVGLVVVVVFSLTGVTIPLSVEMTAVLGSALAIAYVGTAALILLRSPSSRPWYTGARA